jgi:hypothetical protein
MPIQKSPEEVKKKNQALIEKYITSGRIISIVNELCGDIRILKKKIEKINKKVFDDAKTKSDDRPRRAKKS